MVGGIRKKWSSDTQIIFNLIYASVKYCIIWTVLNETMSKTKGNFSLIRHRSFVGDHKAKKIVYYWFNL